jgi:hypothetical protein
VRGKRGFSTHYFRLRSMEGKVRRLLQDVRFAPIAQVLGLEPRHDEVRSVASGTR